MPVPQIPPAIQQILQGAKGSAHATWWRFWRDLRDSVSSVSSAVENLSSYWYELTDVSGVQGSWQLQNVQDSGVADEEDIWLTFRRDGNLANFSASGRTWCAFRLPRVTEGPPDTNGSPIFEVQYTDNLRSSTEVYPYDGWIPVLKFEETGTLAAVREPGSHGSMLEGFQDLNVKPAFRVQDWDPSGNWAPRLECRAPGVGAAAIEDYIGIGRVDWGKDLQVWEPLTGSAWNDASAPGTLARIRCKDLYGADYVVPAGSGVPPPGVVEIVSLTSAPGEILPPPGPGRMYELVSAAVQYHYDTAAYGNDNGIFLKYGTAGPVLTNNLTGIIGATGDRYIPWDVLAGSALAADMVPNDSIVVQHSSSNPTNPGTAAGWLKVFATVRIHHLD